MAVLSPTTLAELLKQPCVCISNVTVGPEKSVAGELSVATVARQWKLAGLKRLKLSPCSGEPVALFKNQTIRLAVLTKDGSLLGIELVFD